MHTRENSSRALHEPTKPILKLLT